MANITAWGKANIMCFLLEEHSSLARKRKRNQIESNQRDLPRGPWAKNPPCEAGGEGSIPGWEQRSHALQGS